MGLYIKVSEVMSMYMVRFYNKKGSFAGYSLTASLISAEQIRQEYIEQHKICDFVLCPTIWKYCGRGNIGNVKNYDRVIGY